MVASFDHLVGAGEEGRGELQTEGSRCAQIVAELDLRRPLDGKVPRRSPGQDARYVFCRSAEERDAARTVGEEPALVPTPSRPDALGVSCSS